MKKLAPILPHHDLKPVSLFTTDRETDEHKHRLLYFTKTLQATFYKQAKKRKPFWIYR